jgi:hypothetical protein
MNAGTIFVLCLVAGFVMFVIYLTRLSRRTLKQEEEAKHLEDKPPIKRAS